MLTNSQNAHILCAITEMLTNSQNAHILCAITEMLTNSQTHKMLTCGSAVCSLLFCNKSYSVRRRARDDTLHDWPLARPGADCMQYTCTKLYFANLDRTRI